VQTITLTLNIGYNGAGIIGADRTTSFPHYSNVGDSLSGQTVSQILTAANGALAGDSLPLGMNSAVLRR